MNAPEKITLAGTEALDKFILGKDIWNDYIDKNNIGDIDFSNTEFAGVRNFNQTLDFSGYHFPIGFVNFAEANFGAGNVSFVGAIFNKGDVSFNGIKLVRGDVFFKDAEFGEGNVFFTRIKDVDGNFVFDNVDFGKGSVSFEHSMFKEHISFAKLTNPNSILKLSFRNSSFASSVDLSGNKFSCVPDLTNTKLTNQISLDRLECAASIDSEGNPDPLDIERLCRLKELAAANKDHDQALYFHIQGMRAKRQQLDRSISGRLFHYLDYLFDITSEYGRSISKPAKWIFRTFYTFSIVYWVIGFVQNMEQGIIKSLGNGLLYALSQILPFTASGRVSATESARQLFSSADIPNWFFAISLSQGLVSFIFIFLLGLGLRNKFRI